MVSSGMSVPNKDNIDMSWFPVEHFQIVQNGNYSDFKVFYCKVSSHWYTAPTQTACIIYWTESIWQLPTFHNRVLQYEMLGFFTNKYSWNAALEFLLYSVMQSICEAVL
jgi:hypothetical protein